LCFLLIEVVIDVAFAALLMAYAANVTSKCAAPVLQRREPYAKHQGKLTVPGKIGDTITNDGQGLVAVVMQSQLSLSYAQNP
jgi:hypothetical protein